MSSSAKYIELTELKEGWQFYGSVIIIACVALGAFLCHHFALEFFESFEISSPTFLSPIAMSIAIAALLVHWGLNILPLIIFSLLAIICVTTQHPLFIIFSACCLMFSVSLWTRHVSIKYNNLLDKAYEKNDRDYRERATVDY